MTDSDWAVFVDIAKRTGTCFVIKNSVTIYNSRKTKRGAVRGSTVGGTELKLRMQIAYGGNNG